MAYKACISKFQARSLWQRLYLLDGKILHMFLYTAGASCPNAACINNLAIAIDGSASMMEGVAWLAPPAGSASALPSCRNQKPDWRVKMIAAEQRATVQSAEVHQTIMCLDAQIDGSDCSDGITTTIFSTMEVPGKLAWT